MRVLIGGFRYVNRNAFFIRYMPVGLLALCLASAASANTVASITNQNDTTVIANSITGFSTTGADMVGMTVTVNFANSTSQQVVWAACGAGCGQVSGTAGNGT